MIRDITIGQYYPVESPVHKLDPRVKLVGTMVFIISLFVFDTFWGYIVSTLFLALCIKVSKVPLKFIVRGLKTIAVLMCFTLVFNLFLTDGEVLWQWKKIKVTREGIENAFFMAFRLTSLIIGSSLMTLTTTPNSLTDGMETGLRWLKKLRFPVHEIAMMMSIALRFIPILLEETDKIMKAQQARGASFDEGKLMERAKALVPVLVPLFVSAFRRANDLALAMEARCYHGDDGRTKLHPLKYKGRDAIAYLIIFAYFGCAIAIGILL